MGLIKTSQPALHGDQHLADGSDPIPGIGNIPDPTGTDLDDIILSVGPDAFWKLNETSGNTAHDSSGNGHHLTVDTGAGFTAPTWGNPAGPPGETTAGWDGSNTKRLNGSLTAFTDNFTAGIWVNMGSTVYAGEIIGQGENVHSGGGWMIWTHAGATNKFSVFASGTGIDANNPFTVDTWYFVAVVRDAGTWKLYINGLLQAATFTTSPGTGYGGNTWLGSDGFLAHTTYLHNGLLSYAFIANTVLTSTQLLEMYDTGTSGGELDAGLVWTSDGAGSASWQLATVEVAY